MSGKWLSGSVGQVLRLTGMFVATVVTHGLTFTLWNKRGDVQMILLSGPMLLAVLMSSPKRYWPAYGAGWALGMLSLSALRGYPVPVMALAYVLCVLFVYTTAWALGRYRSDQPIHDFPRLLWFLLVAAVLLPLAVTAMVVTLTGMLATPPWLHKVWWHMSLAISLGFVLLTPAVLSLTNPASTLRRDAMPLRSVLPVMVLSLALIWLGWRELGSIETLQPLALIAPVPLLIYVALRTQIPGVGIVNLALGAIAAQLSFSGYGPFLQNEPRATTVSIQLWMVGTSVASLFFAALVEQRRATQRALSASGNEVMHLAGRLIVAQEQERARIARDLHDNINQRLAVASMRLSALRPKLDDRNRNDVSQLQSDLIALSSDIRHLSHGLHPSMLAQIGLTAALDELCMANRQHNGPAIDLKMPAIVENLPADVALCLYRVAQEALGNALKHARAKRITLVLRIDARQVDLDIRDDGKGFDLRATGRRGLGLMSIGERTRLLGGSYRLHSTPGQGTELGIRIPLAAQAS
ncbi:sensor histidine kinase [Dyella japonica]|uniref:sensor histidine kinase n=1 Tax=Dyella japonica TaxID=231455 RepID=UPI000AE0B4DE|nr:ATP-binding protein [Dyella japonica]